MVMVWLEGGQGEVRGACAPPPPTPQIAPPGPPPPHHHPELPHLDPPPTDPPGGPPPPLLYPPPIRPPCTPPFNPPPPPPPQGASGQQLVGGVVGVQNRRIARPVPCSYANYRQQWFFYLPWLAVGSYGQGATSGPAAGTCCGKFEADFSVLDRCHHRLLQCPWVLKCQFQSTYFHIRLPGTVRIREWGSLH